MMPKRLKSFKDLNNVVVNDEFHRFVAASAEERFRILSDYGLEYFKQYEGRYNQRTNTVIIESAINPFTGQALQVQLINKEGIKVPDKVLVLITLTAFREKDKPTPESIFGGILVSVVENKKIKQDTEGIPIYRNSDVEREDRERKKKELEKRRQILFEMLLTS